MADVKIYNSNEIQILINLVPIKSGRADGAFLKIEFDSDDYSDSVGSDGEVIRNALNDLRATATLILTQKSDSNSVLSTMRLLGLKSGNGADVGPFLAKDNLGKSLFMSDKCWIKKPPTSEFAKEAGTREWPIRIGSLYAFNGN